MALNTPQKFSRSIGPQITVMNPVYAKYFQFLNWGRDPVSILDVGVGDGRFAKEIFIPTIPNKLKEFVGCDISESALQLARNANSSSIFKFIEMDIGTPDLPAEMCNRFDKVLSNFALHNVKKKSFRLAFRNIYQCLKPRGQILLCTFRQTPTDPVYEMLDKDVWSKYENWKAYSPFYKENTKEGLTKIIEETGFRNCQVDLVPDLYVRFEEKELDDLFLSVNSRLPFVDEDDRDAYAQDYLHNLKTSGDVREVGNINGRKVFDMLYQLVMILGTKTS